MSYSYMDNLEPSAKARYKAKLEAVGLQVCPFQLPGDVWVDQPTEWPDVEWGDIYMYLTSTAGAYSNREMKNYKSLDAHRYFTAGFVQTVHHHITENGSVIFMANVRPSQRVNDPSHCPWIATDKDGIVLAGHCNCMAGLGETCSHVAAVLFKIEAAVRLGITKLACTSKPCAWNNYFTDRVQPAPIKNIKFYKEAAVSRVESTNRKRRSTSSLPGSSTEQQQVFLQSLSTCKVKSVALSLFGETASVFKSKRVVKPAPSLPKPLRSYFSEDHCNLSTADLQEKCTHVVDSIRINEIQANYLEEQTRSQSQSVVWYEQRPGHISASFAHTVLHTNQINPSPSVITGVTKMSKKQINAAPLVYGREKEGEVFASHKIFISANHTNGVLSKVGMKVAVNRPWLAATADGIMTCDCHGSRVVEIKCPYTAREKMAVELLEDPSSYVYRGALRYDHKYYVQVQLQMSVYGVTSCDFLVKTKDRNIITVVERDNEFLDNILPKLEAFWKRHIIPELLTRQIENSEKEPLPSAAGSSSVYCYCQQPWDGNKQLVGCDGVACPFQWVHLACIRPRRKTVPKGKWYCRACKTKK